MVAVTTFQLLPVGREGCRIGSADDEHLLNVESQTVPSPQRGGTEEESKRGAASEGTPPSQGKVGVAPRTRRAPTQGLAFRYPSRYF